MPAWQRDGERTDRQHITGWERQANNQRILRKHKGICHICGQPGATEVDHVTPIAEGGDDTDNNKRPIHHTPCHQNKTRAEAARGRARRSRKRTPEPHPGIRH